MAKTFTWKNVEVPCVPNTATKGIALVSGGKEWTISFSLIVRWENFFTVDTTLLTIDSDLTTIDNAMRRPVAGMRLVYFGRTYQIVSVSEDPSRAYYTLNLADPNSGR